VSGPAPASPGSVRVAVDRDACIGAQTCLAVAPGAFEIDDDGLAVPTDAHAVDPALLVQAARECPTGAITVIGIDPAPSDEHLEEPT
jgi:ferredoxin